MSYCRFSSDGFQCDVYAYEDTAGCWTIHLASRRHIEVAPLMEDYFRLTKDGQGWDNDSIVKWNEELMKWNERQDLKSDEERYINLNLPYDNESFHVGTLGEFFDKMTELARLGYKFDPGVLLMILEEIDEFGRDHTVKPDKDVPEESRYGGEVEL